MNNRLNEVIDKGLVWFYYDYIFLLSVQLDQLASDGLLVQG